MSAPEDFDRHLDWVRQAHDAVLAALDWMAEPAFAEPSRLPDWSRAHVAAHLARNADGLRNLVTWATTGVETAMYESAEAREADIETTARRAPWDLREDVAKASNRLVEDLEDLPGPARAVEVQGMVAPRFPAALLPWQRVRECWVHLVDLDVGVGFDGVPPAVQVTLLDEAADRAAVRPAAAVVLMDAGSGRRWSLGDPGAADPVVASGAAADLLAWLTGRGAGNGLHTAGDRPMPSPPFWP